MTLLELHEKLRIVDIALNQFINTIEATGGVTVDDFGMFHPVADPDWIDLGDVYMLACAALEQEPKIIKEETDGEDNEKEAAEEAAEQTE